MRFLYGVLLGVLASIIAAILYLALSGGEYLVILSPKYQEMKSELHRLQQTEQQREVLADKLRDLERRFTDLGERFTGMKGREEAGKGGGPMPTMETMPTPTEEPTPSEP